jgi:hypothetical protein
MEPGAHPLGERQRMVQLPELQKPVRRLPILGAIEEVTVNVAAEQTKQEK